MKSPAVTIADNLRALSHACVLMDVIGITGKQTAARVAIHIATNHQTRPVIYVFRIMARVYTDALILLIGVSSAQRLVHKTVSMESANSYLAIAQTAVQLTRCTVRAVITNATTTVGMARVKEKVDIAITVVLLINMEINVNIHVITAWVVIATGKLDCVLNVLLDIMVSTVNRTAVHVVGIVYAQEQAGRVLIASCTGMEIIVICRAIYTV